MSDSSNRFEAFAQMEPILRHYAYGEGPYHHALGYGSPVLVPSGTIEGCPAIGYFNPVPGSIQNFERVAKARDSDTVLKIYLQGCREDGLTFVPNEKYRQPGFQTLALFHSSETVQPIFARAEGDRWVVKEQMDVERSFDSPKAIKDILPKKEDEKPFVVYMIAPVGTQPLSYSQFKLNPLTVSANGNGKTVRLFEMEKPNNLSWSVVPSLWLKLDAEKQIASAYDPETLEPISMDLPIPAWRRPAPIRPVPQPPEPRSVAPRTLAPQPYV